MDFEEKIENNPIGINSNDHNQKSDDNMYDKAAEILEKYKRDAILEDNYSDLETQKFDISMSDDYMEGQEDNYDLLSRSGQEFQERLEDNVLNLLSSYKFIFIVIVMFIMLVLDYFGVVHM